MPNNSSASWLAFGLASLCVALPAQAGKPAKPDKNKPATGSPADTDGKPDPKAKTAAKTAKEVPKDDALTAKDPVIVAIDKFRKAKVSTKRADWKTALPAPPVQAFDGKHDYFWHLETSQGALTIRLLPDAAPMHVTSTIYLARCGFYDDLQFPRIVEGFMAQGGSPLNTQSGNAGYTMDGEFLTGRKHDGPGMLSAANSGTPNTDGSQFFLTFAPAPHLDGKHTVFGVAIDAAATLKAIEACGGKDGVPPKETVTILRSWITVVEKVAPKPTLPAAKPGEPVKDAPPK